MVRLRRNDLVIVRDVTVRPELRYGVIKWRDKRDRDGKLEGLVKRGRQRFREGAKILVFRGSVKAYKELGKRFS